MINQLRKLVPDTLHVGQEVSHANSSATHGTYNSTQTDKPYLLHVLSTCCARIESEQHQPEKLVLQQKFENNERLLSFDKPCPLDHTLSLTSRLSGNSIMGSPMHTRPILPLQDEVSQLATIEYGCGNNIDLICSIADTYELPSDSDTYSYLSNCLIQRNYEPNRLDSVERSVRRSQGSIPTSCQKEHQTSPPTDMNGISKTGRHRKYRRRSRSQPASLRRSRHQNDKTTKPNIMTDSNCSTVIL